MSARDEQPIITIGQGRLKGRTDVDYRGGLYYSFLGIPYAKPPLGKLRFKAPSPPETWEGIRDATTEGSECISRHMIYRNVVGSDDCLYLNVYTSKLSDGCETSLKPVMVWIHGGGFTTGSSKKELYGPEFLLPEDVVIVTFNYRLGLLGFLSLYDTSLGVPGNAGMKDMVMALKWVQTNIRAFGGDAQNVTIFGESAGGSAVHYLTLSPMAKDLFHKAIIQSGGALIYSARGSRNGKQLAKALGKEDADEKELLEILEKLPLNKLLEVQDSFHDVFTLSQRRPHGPVIEQPSNEPAFMLEEPVDLLTSGRYWKVPLLTGFNSREGMLAEAQSKEKFGEVKLITDFEDAVPYFLNVPRGSEKSRKIAHKIKEFYYGEENPNLENIDRYYVLNTDNFYVRDLQRNIKYQVATNRAPIYLYRLSIESTLNFYKVATKIKNPGVCHGDDLGYLFTNMFTPKIFEGSIEDITIRRITKLWCNFARYGNPNGIKNDPSINVYWPSVQEGQLNFLDIGENLTVGVNPEAYRMAFWEEIFHECGVTAK